MQVDHDPRVTARDETGRRLDDLLRTVESQLDRVEAVLEKPYAESIPDRPPGRRR